MSMGLLRLLRGKKATAPVARERLQILLAHERGLRGQPDLLGLLREEILAVVSRHVTLDPTKVIVRLERGDEVQRPLVVPQGDRSRPSRSISRCPTISSARRWRSRRGRGRRFPFWGG